jgi:hypothetical protein
MLHSHVGRLAHVDGEIAIQRGYFMAGIGEELVDVVAYL